MRSYYPSSRIPALKGCCHGHPGSSRGRIQLILKTGLLSPYNESIALLRFVWVDVMRQAQEERSQNLDEKLKFLADQKKGRALLRIQALQFKFQEYGSQSHPCIQGGGALRVRHA